MKYSENKLEVETWRLHPKQSYQQDTSLKREDTEQSFLQVKIQHITVVEINHSLVTKIRSHAHFLVFIIICTELCYNISNQHHSLLQTVESSYQKGN